MRDDGCGRSSLAAGESHGRDEERSGDEVKRAHLTPTGDWLTWRRYARFDPFAGQVFPRNFGYDDEMMRYLPVSAVALVVASVVACGGKTALDDLSAGTAGTGTGSGAGGGGATGSGGVTGGSGSGSTGTSGSVSGPPSAGPAPASAAITCGKTSCNLATQDCCIQDASGVASCTTKGQCQGVALSCTSSANCVNGEVCCVQLDQGSQAASCQTSCDSGPGGGPGDPGGDPGDPGDPGGGPGDGPGGAFRLCASTAECAKGETCQRTPLGFGVCIGGRGKGQRPPPPPKH